MKTFDQVNFCLFASFLSYIKNVEKSRTNKKQRKNNKKSNNRKESARQWLWKTKYIRKKSQNLVFYSNLCEIVIFALKPRGYLYLCIEQAWIVIWNFIWISHGIGGQFEIFIWWYGLCFTLSNYKIFPGKNDGNWKCGFNEICSQNHQKQWENFHTM